MTSLATEFRQLLARRIECATPAEVLAIAGSLLPEQPAPLRAVGPTPRFTQLDDGQVLDNANKLIWTHANVPGGRMNWKAAHHACTALRLGDSDTWQLPTVREMLTLVDYERKEPAIDPEFECEPTWYWTSTPAAGSPGAGAWSVSFYNGSSAWAGQNDLCFVRAVRPSQ